MDSTKLRSVCHRKKIGTHFTEGWVGLVAGLNGTENLTPPGTRSHERPAHSKSFYKPPAIFHTIQKKSSFCIMNDYEIKAIERA